MKQNEPMGSILTPYKQAVDELKVKLKGLRKQYEVGENTSPIEFVTGRVKPISSIIDKANKRGIPFDRLHEEMYDIAGLRMMCQFVDDIDVVVDILRQRRDFKVIEERDYIRNTKRVVIVLIMSSLSIQLKRLMDKTYLSRDSN